MSTTYRLQARPFLRPKGEFKQQLHYVEFLAESEIDELSWTVDDLGQLYLLLTVLSTRTNAERFMDQLHDGHLVLFPRLYTEEQLTSLEKNDLTLAGGTSSSEGANPSDIK